MAENVPCLLLQPARQMAAVILTSPHSGRRYDAGFLASSRLDAVAIRRSEDSFVEELFEAAPKLGIPLLAAEFPRAYCDVNREPWELDPAMFADALPDYANTNSPRVHSGLGTIARIVGTGEAIYAGKLRFAEAQARVNACWKPFHAALRAQIDKTVAQFGTCLVIDCHSMPSLPGRRMTQPDVILGDGHGTCCAPGWTGHIQTCFEGMGLSVHRNEPYSGGYITRHYGKPRDGVQAIQVELSRSLYMNERNFARSAQFGPTQRQMTRFLEAVIEASQSWGALGAHAAE